MTDVRRVLLVEPLAGARWRSITAYAGSLAEMLRGGGIEVDVAQAPWFNPPSLLEGVRGRWWREERVRRALERGYDIVHLTDQALGHHARRFREGAPVVVTCHDLMPFTLPGYYATRRERWLKRAFLRKPTKALSEADVVVAVSEFTQAELRAWFGEGMEPRVVPNVVRPAFRARERGEAEQELAAAGIALPGGPRILSVGNDRAYKNLPALIEAMAQPALAHATLVRVGPLTVGQRGLAESLGVLRRTALPEGLDDEQLARVYAACDVLAQPSLAEGFGIPVIEAMACGLPVVVSDGGSLAEVVEDAGVVVPLAGEEFPRRFAAGMVGAMARRDELGRMGLIRAEAFRPNVVLPRLLEAYGAAGQVRKG